MPLPKNEMICGSRQNSTLLYTKCADGGTSAKTKVFITVSDKKDQMLIGEHDYAVAR